MEQLSGRQYGEWLKAKGVIKNGGEKEKEKVKVQSEAEKGARHLCWWMAKLVKRTGL